MNSIKLIWLAGISLCGMAVGSAQNWMPTSAPSNSWHCITASADATKLAIGAYQTLGTPTGGPIYLSTDSGASWVKASVGTNKWSSIASSADGTRLFAVADDGIVTACHVFLSTNSGASWSTNNLGKGLSLVSSAEPVIACSADGSKLVATYYGIVWVSTNSGNTWTSNSPPSFSTPNWFSAACSADGKKMVLARSDTRTLYTSTNSGTTWLQLSNLLNYGYPAVSADGNTIALSMNLGASPHIYVSTNMGTSWTTNSQPLYAGGMAMSADGAKMVAAGANGWIRYSTNAGTSWMTNDTLGASQGAPNLAWAGAVISADGCRWFLTAQPSSNTNSARVYALQLTPSPYLSLEFTNCLQLSWLRPSTYFALQQSTDLAAWSDVTNEPVLNLTNLDNKVALPWTPQNTFFRLKTP